MLLYSDDLKRQLFDFHSFPVVQFSDCFCVLQDEDARALLAVPAVAHPRRSGYPRAGGALFAPRRRADGRWRELRHGGRAKRGEPFPLEQQIAQAVLSRSARVHQNRLND